MGAGWNRERAEHLRGEGSAGHAVRVKTWAAYGAGVAAAAALVVVAALVDPGHERQTPNPDGDLVNAAVCADMEKDGGYPTEAWATACEGYR